MNNKSEVITSFLKDKDPFDLNICFNEKIPKICYKEDTPAFAVFMQFHLNIHVNWLRKYQGTHVITFSSYGWCNTFNIVNQDQLFYENSTAEYFDYKPSSNIDQTKVFRDLTKAQLDPPLFTSKSDFGFRAISFHLQNVTVVVHSPYETPDSRHRSYSLYEFEVSRLTIEPQIRITDETLLALDVDE